jgi:hypothetical protein
MFDHLRIDNISSRVQSRIESGLPIEEDKATLTWLKIWLGENKIIQSIAQKLIRYRVFAEREKKTGKTIELHNTSDIEQAESFDSDFGYKDDLQELNCAIKYLKQIKAGFPTASESEVLYAKSVEILSDVLSKHEEVKFLNFGVNLAHIDHLLAERFPNVTFTGIDRSKLTKAFNEINYPKLPNIELIAGDIFELLEERSFEGGIFFHMRTLTFLPKGFAEKLYRAARNAQFKYLIGFEPMGISRETKSAYEFSLDEQPSVAYRGHAFIHNYPELTRRAGYSIRESGLIETDHAHEDYRIIYFIAEQITGR